MPRALPVGLSLLVLSAVLLSTGACGAPWGGQDAPTGVSLLAHDMTSDMVGGLGVDPGQVIALTLVVSDATDAFALWAYPSDGTLVTGSGRLVVEHAGVAGQVIGVFWSTEDYEPGTYVLVAVMADGETLVLSDPIQVG